jgi:hypothetical protein
MVNVVQSL